MGAFHRLPLPLERHEGRLLAGHGWGDVRAGVAGMWLYGIVPSGWMVCPVMGLGLSGWTVAQPAVMAIMSRAVPANEQGLLQGAIAGADGLTAVLAPPVWTGIFAYFASPAAPMIVPGAAFFASGLVFAGAATMMQRLRAPGTGPGLTLRGAGRSSMQ